MGRASAPSLLCQRRGGRSGPPTGGTRQKPQHRSDPAGPGTGLRQRRHRAVKALIFAKLFLLPGSSPSSPIFRSARAGSPPGLGTTESPGRCRGAEELRHTEHITGASTPKPPQSVKPVWPIQLHHLLSPCGALEQSCKPGLCWEITPGMQNTPNPSLWVLEVWAAVQTMLSGSCSKTLPTLLPTKLN